MKTRLAALTLCLLALILCVTPVIVAEVRRNQPITIETELAEGELVEDVVLSKGYLHFKTRDEVLEQYLSNHHDTAKPLLDELQKISRPASSLLLDTPRNATVLSEDHIADLMNQHPGQWHIPKQLSESRVDFRRPLPFTNESETRFALLSPIFRYEYALEIPDSVPQVIDRAAGWVCVEVTAGNPETVFINQLGQEASDYGLRIASYSDLLSANYGDIDSQIGDIPLSAYWYEYDSANRIFAFSAAFTVANVGYFVHAAGISQQEFIELLISIVEAPHPETRNVIEYILEG